MMQTHKLDEAFKGREAIGPEKWMQVFVSRHRQMGRLMDPATQQGVHLILRRHVQGVTCQQSSIAVKESAKTWVLRGRQV